MASDTEAESGPAGKRAKLCICVKHWDTGTLGHYGSPS